jgi:hypothetical protein
VQLPSPSPRVRRVLPVGPAQFKDSNAASSSAASQSFGSLTARTPLAHGFSTGGKRVARSKALLQYGDTDIDLSAVEQLVEQSQTRAIGDAISTLARDMQAAAAAGSPAPLRELLDALEARIDAQGLDCLSPGAHVGTFARPRKFEIAAALNRLRTAQFASR